MSKVLDENGLSALWEAIIGTCPRMAAGSYRGTGTYGQNNPSSLVFDFVPVIVIIHQGTEICIMTPTMTTNFAGTTGSGWATRSSYNSGTAYTMTVMEWGTTVKWWTSTGGGSDYQFNSSSWIYDYVAFG